MRALVSATVLVASSTAHAAPEPVEYEDTSYPVSLMLATGMSASLTVGALALDGDIPYDAGAAMLVAGEVGIAFSGAIVHLAHGESKRAWASVGIRGAGALLGAGIGPAFTADTLEGTLDGIGYGLIVGLGTAVVLETVLLTGQRSPRSEKPSPPPPRAWAPVISATNQGGQLGIAGAF